MMAYTSYPDLFQLFLAQQAVATAAQFAPWQAPAAPLANKEMDELVNRIREADYQDDEKTILSIFDAMPSDLPLYLAFKEPVVRGKIYYYFLKKQYDLVFALLEQHTFTGSRHKLQQMWYSGHYALEEIRKNKKLCPVARYRVRKRFPLPAGLQEPAKSGHHFSQLAVDALTRVYKQNPLPNGDMRRRLMNETGLSLEQIATWFKNRRQRDRNSNSPGSRQRSVSATTQSLTPENHCQPIVYAPPVSRTSLPGGFLIENILSNNTPLHPEKQ